MSTARVERLDPAGRRAARTEYSLFSRDVEADILLACREPGVGFVAYRRSQGVLTGQLSSTDQLATVTSGADARTDAMRTSKWSAPEVTVGG